MLIGLTGRVKQHECEVGLREPLLLYKTFQTIENSSSQLKIWAEKKNANEKYERLNFELFRFTSLVRSASESKSARKKINRRRRRKPISFRSRDGLSWERRTARSLTSDRLSRHDGYFSNRRFQIFTMENYFS